MKILRKTIRLLPLLFLLPLFACSQTEADPASVCPTVPQYNELSYSTVACRIGTLRETVTVRFTYKASMKESLRFPVSDVPYDSFYVSEGDTVKAGELLAALDPGDYPVLLSNAKQETESLKARLDTLEKQHALSLQKEALLRSRSSDAEYRLAVDRINSEYQLNKTAVEDQISILSDRISEYEKALSDRTIYAPFDGMVTYLYHPEPTDVSKKTQDIVTIADTSEMYFIADTEHADFFRKNPEVTIRIGDREQAAHTVSPENASADGRVFLALTTPDPELESGDIGFVEIELLEKKDVLTIPAGALTEINGKPAVYVLNEDGFRTFKYVTVGIRSRDEVEILDGLSENEEILLLN